METIIGLKHLRENVEDVAAKISHGETFIVTRKSKPLFKITPITEDTEAWESVADFTKIKRGGVALRDILSRL